MDIVKFTFVIQMLRLAHHHATEAVNGELLIYTLKTYAAQLKLCMKNYDHVTKTFYLDVMQMMIPQPQLSPLA